MIKIVKIEIPVDEKVLEILESFTDHMAEMKEELVELRKKGADTSIVDILLIDFMPRVNFAKATGEQKDIDAVKRLLARIRNELDAIKEGSEFDAVLEKINLSNDLIREGKFAEAAKHYETIKKNYNSLDPELKRAVYKISLEIHKHITSKGSKNG